MTLISATVARCISTHVNHMHRIIYDTVKTVNSDKMAAVLDDSKIHYNERESANDNLICERNGE